MTMRKTLLMFLLGLVLTGCRLGVPQIALDNEWFDLGEVVNGEIVSWDLSVRNEGEAPLVIEAVSTSCGCTKATLDPMTIPPGESGNLHIEFDSGAHGPELTGELIRQVFIASNDPERSEVKVEFVATILTSSSD